MALGLLQELFPLIPLLVPGLQLDVALPEPLIVSLQEVA
jgi:hypothetical protein